MLKHPPEKLEYWRRYRRENVMRCREQRSQWREANRERIRLCARRCYYRKLLCDGQRDSEQIQKMICELDDQIADILLMESH